MAKAKFSSLIKQSSVPVLVDFYADWCQPCRILSPTVKKVAEKLGDQVKVIKINVDRNRAVSQQYNIRSIPTLVLFNKGNVVWRQAGVLSEGQIINKIKPHLGKKVS